ncbi:MAG: sigma-70 family RNA polymerase sigma factor [Planctomycetaceae bacterium]
MLSESSERQHRTRRTLLSRVRDISDVEAWQEFVRDYGPQILRWCQRQGLQESDCADVVQDVLTRLVIAMRSFDYEPGKGRFRGWLKTVTQNAIRDFVRHHQRAGIGSGDSAVSRLLHAVSDPSTVDGLSDALEKQAEIELLREAEARVRLRVKPTNWKAWYLTVRDQQSAPQAAAELNIAVTDVYVARSRISRMITEEVQKLDPLILGDDSREH